MSDTRYYAEAPCEHGHATTHPLPYWDHAESPPSQVYCPGGSRVEVKPIEPDYDKAAEALYLMWAGPNPNPPWEEIRGGDWDNAQWQKESRAAVDAALAGGVLVEVDDG